MGERDKKFKGRLAPIGIKEVVPQDKNPLKLSFQLVKEKYLLCAVDGM